MRLADINIGDELFIQRYDYKAGRRKKMWFPCRVVAFETVSGRSSDTRIVIDVAGRGEERCYSAALHSQTDLDEAKRVAATIETRIEEVKSQLAAMGFKENSPKGYRLKSGQYPRFLVGLELLEQLLLASPVDDDGGDSSLAEALGLD